MTYLQYYIQIILDQGARLEQTYPALSFRRTTDDPKRPMFAPVPSETAGRNGIIAFQHVVSDDGTLALVEFVVANRAALSPILTSTAPGVIVFEAGKYTQAQIETVFKKYKASFSFDNFRSLRVQ